MDRRQAMALLQLMADCYLIVQTEDSPPEMAPAGTEVEADFETSLEPEPNGSGPRVVIR